MREKLFALSLGFGALILVTQSQAAIQRSVTLCMTNQNACAFN